VESQKEPNEEASLYLEGKNILELEYNKIISITNLEGRGVLNEVELNYSNIGLTNLSHGTYYIIYEDKNENIKRLTILK
jgi:hypothetical protein